MFLGDFYKYLFKKDLKEDDFGTSIFMVCAGNILALLFLKSASFCTLFVCFKYASLYPSLLSATLEFRSGFIYVQIPSLISIIRTHALVFAWKFYVSSLQANVAIFLIINIHHICPGLCVYNIPPAFSKLKSSRNSLDPNFSYWQRAHSRDVVHKQT